MSKVLFYFCVLFLNYAAQAQRIVPYYGPFPEPAPNQHVMFYLQRTVDRNTVIYELNYDASGELNPKKPLKIYWIDFENGARITPLTFAQSKFAYGIESEISDEKKKIFRINLVSYKKVKLILKPTGKNNQYQTHVLIKGKPAILIKIHVNIIGGTHISPVVSYLELVGQELDTGLIITERIKPGRD